MKQWLIIFCCVVFVMASVLTTGLVRALIDLSAFIAILALVWHQDSAKVENIE
ncbi:hypothetical protein TUM4644_23080 [Shewanella colwelliana]|uniref:Uncharacterized protein n=1 Tax=Shewanella colwelliana TaxID=23 RepID=A0ABQ4P6G1_SHECO|nr:hypothetical protein [Shewanella colwelliana]MDX1280775.1 hypothetical protein [Shewanella colwelliana]GIU26749.1 hypothetical protein TUM4644_23080 [Shewanella colwelliana]GIU43066.1 hypothetical protein TUM3794_27860 [Shewanella colwelliana]